MDHLMGAINLYGAAYGAYSMEHLMGAINHNAAAYGAYTMEHLMGAINHNGAAYEAYTLEHLMGAINHNGAAYGAYTMEHLMGAINHNAAAYEAYTMEHLMGAINHNAAAYEAYTMEHLMGAMNHNAAAYEAYTIEHLMGIINHNGAAYEAYTMEHLMGPSTFMEQRMGHMDGSSKLQNGGAGWEQHMTERGCRMVAAHDNGLEAAIAYFDMLNTNMCSKSLYHDGNQGKHRVTKRGPALSYPMFTLVTSEDIAGSVSHTPIQRCGELHFLQIGGTCDDLDETDILVDGSLTKAVEQLTEGIKPMSNPSSPCITGVDLLVEQPFSLEMLTCLVELTRFETLIPRFSATVPPCWVEVQQEQQQRRHPQHLHQQHHGDAAQHTRTWKLQNDSASWDEHVFELVLPKACMVGHVDFKFLLNSNITNIPQIQVTLLKNKAPGLAKVNETPVDRHISFPLSAAFNVEVQRNGRPTLVDLNEDMQNMEVEDSQCARLCPFLEEHKEDILCGPVWLASGLDLSGHAGMLTLTSPKLVKGMAGGKYRSFLIHVKAVNDRGAEDLCNGGTRPVVRMPSIKPQSVKGHSLASLLAKVVPGKDKSATKIDTSTSSRKVDNLRGCDLLQEVSVTIRRFKKTCIPKERVQRCAMLQFSDFHEKLLNTLCKKTSDGLATEHAQSLVLDILCWLAGVLREGKESLLNKTRRCLSDIVRTCFFEAGRSIAHKCARFLALCISNGKCDPNQQGFGFVLLKALLENITYLPSAATGGAVYWYFVLLNYVKDEDLAGCSTACASLLTAVSRQLQDRLTPMEALLQTRYGLYSSPFDPVLFDLEVSGSSCKNIYNSSSGIQSDEIDLSDVLLVKMVMPVQLPWCTHTWRGSEAKPAPHMADAGYVVQVAFTCNSSNQSYLRSLLFYHLYETACD
ncbi:unnamed protein product, partial [Ranitomeya imitator]